MKLKRFKKYNKRIIMIIIAVATLIGLVVSITRVMSHAYFKTSKSFNVIQGKIPNKNNGDVRLAVFIGDQKVDTFPDKKNHKYVETVCNEDSHANISFDPNTWKLNIDGIDSKTICTIKFETKTNLDLDGSEPVIKDGLLPVVIADNGVVTKTTKDNLNWYDYNNSKWANAVILTGTDTYQIGDPIPEEAIESYFVWIPKYKYKLFNIEGSEISAQKIEVEIGDYNTTNSDTECVATNESGNIGTCKNDMWMTHPAFTSLGVNGFWVGKFETGYKGSTDTSSAEKDENAPEKVQIKPNVNSWRDMIASNGYKTSFNYKRNLDSHMMKNTEWGAVAYLTNSKYGRGNTEVWINNNSNYVTGCVGNSVLESEYNGCQNSYNTTIGYHGSTTDNISGIYDASGGTWERIMGIYNDVASQLGFTQVNVPDKYIDRYAGTDQNYKILGDATGETKGWYGSWARFVHDYEAVFYRGGAYNDTTPTGVFSVVCSGPGAGSYYSFRIVLSPTN